MEADEIFSISPLTLSVLAMSEKLGGASGSPTILSAFRMSRAGASLIPSEVSSPVVVTSIVIKSMKISVSGSIASSCWLAGGRSGGEVVVEVVVGGVVVLGRGGGGWGCGGWSVDWLAVFGGLGVGLGREDGFAMSRSATVGSLVGCVRVARV